MEDYIKSRTNYFKLIPRELKIEKLTDIRIEPESIQGRKMKTKKHINSIYKRKKRKLNNNEIILQDYLEREEEEKVISPVLRSQTETSLSIEKKRDNQSMLLLTTTNKSRTDGNSSRSNVLLFWLAFVTAINIAQLICDTSNTWSVFGADLEEPPNRQRFVKEPEDALALLGEPIELPCLIENKRGVVSWSRNTWYLGEDKITGPYEHRYSMPNQNQHQYRHQHQHQHQQQRQATPQTNDLTMAANQTGHSLATTSTDSTTDEQTPAHTTTITNSSLYIKSVSLADDSNFRCAVGTADSHHRAILSKVIKLTVLSPPSKLSIGILEDDPQQQASSTFISLQDALSPESSASSPNSDINNRMESQSNDWQVGRYSVIEDTRLKLACRTDQAKPHAELVWLDHLQHQVPKKEINFNNLNSNNLNLDQGNFSAKDHDSFVEELVSSEPNQPKLASSTLVWPLHVKRHHSNQVLTCIANHPAFEQERVFPKLFKKQLRRQVRLEVLYKPTINLTKNLSPLFEDKSVKFHCDAHARPNKLKYRWFIDTELITNATDSELRIDRLTRQMHSRSLICEVSNQVGQSRAVMRLDIKYAPAFITHLLPASLQPDLFEPPPSALLLAQQRSAALNKSYNENGTTTSNLTLKPTVSQVILARQLAVTYEEGHDVQLRCDFDSNPGLQQVLWYKANTNYSIWANITPSEADELIAFGAMHAAIKRKISEPHLKTILNTGEANLNEENIDVEDDYVASAQADHEHSKRHIITNDDPDADLSASGEPIAIDYAQMSADLLDELSTFEMSQLLVKDPSQPLQQQQQLQQVFDSKIEQIPTNSRPTQTDVFIQEPLGWTMAKQLTRTLNKPAGLITDDSHAQQQQVANEQAASLNLIQLATPKSNGETTFPAIKMKDRRAHVSSSFITLPAARRDVDVIGKYICKAKPADGFPASARAVYLVKRQGPRIISHREQWAMSNKGRAQIECLAQVNTVIDSSITWYKDEKLILEAFSQRENSTRKYWQILQASPDLLFMRSTLNIEDLESSDFGEYICRVSNSINSDSTPIKLNQYASTGYVFAIMASLSIGTALVLVCAFVMLLTYAPQQKIDAKVSMSNIKTTVNQEPDNRRNSFTSQKSTTDSSQTCGGVVDGLGAGVVQPPNHKQPPSSLMQQIKQHCDQMNQNNNNSHYATEQINSSDNNSPLMLGASYQQQQQPMPTVNGGDQSYYSALSIQPLMNRPCYATICIPGQHQPCQFVPTSDAGDAYIDANYDTLIRNSVANKTTNYVPASPTTISATLYSGQQQQINGTHHPASLASSSPNSLTTHTNLSNGYNHQQDLTPKHQQQQQQYNSLQSELINGTEQLYTINNKQDTSHNQVTLILTNGTATTTTVEAKNLNFNSLATHV